MKSYSASGLCQTSKIRKCCSEFAASFLLLCYSNFLTFKCQCLGWYHSQSNIWCYLCWYCARYCFTWMKKRRAYFRYYFSPNRRVFLWCANLSFLGFANNPNSFLFLISRFANNWQSYPRRSQCLCQHSSWPNLLSKDWFFSAPKVHSSNLCSLA